MVIVTSMEAAKGTTLVIERPSSQQKPEIFRASCAKPCGNAQMNPQAVVENDNPFTNKKHPGTQGLGAFVLGRCE